MSDKPELRLCDLYPHLNEDELLQVEDAFDRYLALVIRIFERMELDKIDPFEGQLTSHVDTVR